MINLKYYKDGLNRILDTIKFDELSEEQYDELYNLYDDLYYYYDEFEMDDEEYSEYRLLLLSFKGTLAKYWKN